MKSHDINIYNKSKSGFFLELGLWVDLGGIDANAWSISAPKMEGASISMHVASGILKIASLEVEKSSDGHTSTGGLGDRARCPYVSPSRPTGPTPKNHHLRAHSLKIFLYSKFLLRKLVAA